MSTRWYPVYQRGNPQLRIFLPNFWMKLIRPAEEQPKNVATFSVSMQMSKYDVKNYLEKIYKLPVVDVRTRIEMGRTKRDQTHGYVTKEDDVKIAYVTLPRTEEFTFPDLFEKKEEQKKAEEKSMDDSKQGFKRFLDRNKKRPGTPGWYSI
ncbi:39S ribosomal protein L23, mitochondrial [Bactrocera neohumeralis]|uniref:39S ribosomal protein L23, mitochondrial n=1 Tax=Bactrocera tryoni TaxID=59916 RepID=UPI001A985F0C|nr:39S ribosomal protein L23, mitochondrial [Bactrocera tryoni]XP_050337327.1 39S ribosomal protein L23, mitochondrial [Bactrocera neohumeralis]